MKAEDIEYKPHGKVIEVITGDSGMEYTLHREQSGEIMCSCPARKICKHIREFKFREEVERVLTLKSYQGKIDFQSDGSYDEVIRAICKLRKDWDN